VVVRSIKVNVVLIRQERANFHHLEGGPRQIAREFGLHPRNLLELGYIRGGSGRER
jgi:hypothetical protein